MGGTAVKPTVLVGTLNVVPIALASALVGAVPVTPLFDRVVLSTVAPAWGGPALVPTFLVLALVGVGLAVCRAVVRHLTVTYRLTEDRIELVRRGWREQRTIVPRSQIRHVSLSAGVLEGHVGGGDVAITVRGPHTKVHVQVREVADAVHWYETLRTVSGDREPRETVSQAIAPGLFKLLGYLAATLGLLGTLSALAAVLAFPGVNVSLILLVTVLLAGGLLAAYHLYAASVRYEIHDDHIERHRIFFGRERSYVVADEIDWVEYFRETSERIFDVGTVALTATWRDEPFRLRAVEGPKSLHDRIERHR
mgnify:CR=1 FL=1